MSDFLFWEDFSPFFVENVRPRYGRHLCLPLVPRPPMCVERSGRTSSVIKAQPVLCGDMKFF